MRRAIAAVVVVGFGIVFADDPPVSPPDRLERKAKPVDSKKSDDKRVEDKKTDGKPEPKAEDERTEDEDPNVVRERLAKNMLEADKRLQTPDAGKATRELQDQILKDIDKLLRRAQNPPPPPQGSPPPQGDPPPENGGGNADKKQPSGGSAQSQPSGGQQSQKQGAGQSRRERREQQRREQQPGKQAGGAHNKQQPNGIPSQPQGKGNPNGPGIPPPSSSKEPNGNDKASDSTKDIWGHLPETLRQEVDHYYREQFMPRYRELVRQYYNRLAEQPKRPKE